MERGIGGEVDAWLSRNKDTEVSEMFVKRRKTTHVRRGVGSRGIGHALVVVVAALLASLLLMSDVVLPVRELVHVERLLVGGGLVILGEVRVVMNLFMDFQSLP